MSEELPNMQQRIEECAKVASTLKSSDPAIADVLSRTIDVLFASLRNGVDAPATGYVANRLLQERIEAMKFDGNKNEPVRFLVYEIGGLLGTLIKKLNEKKGEEIEKSVILAKIQKDPNNHQEPAENNQAEVAVRDDDDVILIDDPVDEEAIKLEPLEEATSPETKNIPLLNEMTSQNDPTNSADTKIAERIVPTSQRTADDLLGNDGENTPDAKLLLFDAEQIKDELVDPIPDAPADETMDSMNAELDDSSSKLALNLGKDRENVDLMDSELDESIKQPLNLGKTKEEKHDTPQISSKRRRIPTKKWQSENDHGEMKKEDNGRKKRTRGSDWTDETRKEEEERKKRARESDYEEDINKEEEEEKRLIKLSKYQCSTCGKVFGQIGHLKDHEVLHTGCRPHSCTHCDSTFTNGSKLKRHTRNVHGIDKFECGKCGVIFKRKLELQAHVKTC